MLGLFMKTLYPVPQIRAQTQSVPRDGCGAESDAPIAFGHRLLHWCRPAGHDDRSVSPNQREPRPRCPALCGPSALGLASGGARNGAGTFSLDAMFDRAADWCLAHLPIEPVRLGREHREVNAIDSSTIARLRAGPRLAWAGKGYCHRAGRAVRANIVAALTAVVMIHGVRVGLVRRTRFGPSCQDAVARVFDALPPPRGNGSSSWMPALPPRSSVPRRPSRTPCWGAYEATSSCGVLLHHPRANAGGVLSTAR